MATQICTSLVWASTRPGMWSLLFLEGSLLNQWRPNNAPHGSTARRTPDTWLAMTIQDQYQGFISTELLCTYWDTSRTKQWVTKSSRAEIGLSTQLANSSAKVFVTSDGPVPAISTALPRSLTVSKKWRLSLKTSFWIRIETYVGAVSFPQVPKKPRLRRVSKFVVSENTQILVKRKKKRGKNAPTLIYQSKFSLLPKLVTNFQTFDFGYHKILLVIYSLPPIVLNPSTIYYLAC